MKTHFQRQQRNAAVSHDRAHRRHPRAGTLLSLLLLLAMAGVPGRAWAVCWFTNGAATTVSFNAGTITLTPSTVVGTVLWTSNTASPANPPILQCDGSTSGGIVNSLAGPPSGSDTTLFPTNIPGISYRILHPDTSNPLHAYPNDPMAYGSFQFSIASNLQLVYTGPFLPPNNSVVTGQLAQWKIDICNNPIVYWGNYYGCRSTVAPQPVELFNVSANIILQVPTCDIDPGSVNKTVTLPSMTTTQFTGLGATPGKTPFSLQLINCPSGEGVFITLNTSNPQAGVAGTIAPSGAGFAGGIGVQILKADGTTPVAFGNAINTGKTTASAYAINLFARYYQTSATTTPGPVSAVATYTLTYQ